MRIMRWAFAGALALGVAVVVEAQQPGQGRGQGKGGQPGAKGGFGQPGGGGFGGFGQPGGFGGGFGGFGGLGGLSGQVTTNKDLQAELKISDEQVEKIKGLREQQAEEMRKLMAKFQEDSRKEFEASLTDAQRARLKQLEVQNQGLRAFLNDETVKPLNLTDSQKTKVKAAVDEANKTIGEARREAFGGGMGGAGGRGGFDPERMAEVNKKVQKLEKQAMADISDLLTADQRKTWEAMIGEPFDTTKLRPQFGGFGGAGGRPTPKKD